MGCGTQAMLHAMLHAAAREVMSVRELWKGFYTFSVNGISLQPIQNLFVTCYKYI